MYQIVSWIKFYPRYSHTPTIASLDNWILELECIWLLWIRGFSSTVTRRLWLIISVAVIDYYEHLALKPVEYVWIQKIQNSSLRYFESTKSFFAKQPSNKDWRIVTIAIALLEANPNHFYIRYHMHVWRHVTIVNST